MEVRSLCQLYFIIVSILHGVTEAVWTLTGSSEFAVAGESFTLTCNPQDSNTVAKSITWRRSGTLLAYIDYISTCIVGNGSDQQYQYTCEPGPIYKLTIPANVMTDSQNNIVWKCDSQFGGTSNNAQYTLTVAVPVSNVFIHGDSKYPNKNVIYENTPKAFTCITNGCRPKANISVTTTGVTEGQRAERQDTQSNGLIVTTVTQTITATRVGDVKTILCSAVNIQGRQPVSPETVTLDVYYIPSEEPTLTRYTTGSVLYEGDNDITLTCQQSGGYPLSLIMWSCDGQTGTTNNSQTVASSYVQLAVNKNLNGRTCTCTVQHPYITSYTKTKSVNFTVYYPPTPTVQTSGTSFPWVENTQGVLKCTISPGNPPATAYEWIVNSQVIAGQTTDTYTIQTLQSEHDGLQIQCRVSNEYTIQRPPAIISDRLMLDVQYTPIITLDTTNITIQEGSGRSRPCSATGNPTPTVKWYRRNSVQTSGTGTTSATLVFSNIDRNQTDTYICRATSTEIRNFVSSKSVSVIVYYPPVVTVTLQNTTENATDAVFTCNADGFPTNYTYHGWKQYIGNTLVRSYTDFNGMLSENNRNITIPKVTFEDTGRYLCYAENGIQGRQPVVLQQGSSYFDVKVSAKFRIDDVRKKGDIDKTLVIRIPFYSNPPAKWSDIVWLNKSNGQQVSNSSLTRYELMNGIVGKSFYGKYAKLNGQVIILTIRMLSNYHFGNYKIIVNNGGLQSSYNFKIVSGATPEHPRNLSVFATKYNSISLKWERGYDGGYPQTFVILVKDMLSDSIREILVKDDKSSSYFSETIYDLLPSTTYQIKIYSMNENGNSSYLSVIVLVRGVLKDGISEASQSVSNTPVIALSVVIVILVVVIAINIIVIWRRGHNNQITGQRSEKKPQIATHYEDISQTNQGTAEYEGINTDHENQNESRGVDTYESLGSTRAAENQNTYQSLEKTESHGSEGFTMELYENTKINSF